MFWLIAYLVCWCGASAFWIYNAMTGADPDRRALSRFYITDFWALIVGLLPSFFALQYFLLSRDPHRAGYSVPVVVLILSQLLGMFIAKITETTRAGSTAPINRWKSAKALVFGAILGIAWIWFVAILMWFLVMVIGCVYMVLWASVRYPAIGAAIVIVAAVILTRRRNSPD